MLGEYSVTAEIVIDRKPEAVFDFVADLENDPQWCRLVPEVTFTGDRSTGLGTYDFVQMLPRNKRTPGTGEILELSRPTALRLRSSFDRTSLEAEYQLQPVGEATRLTHTNHVRWSGTLRLLHPILRWNTKRVIVTQLADLKSLLEAVA